MIRTQVYLTSEERKQLSLLSKELGLQKSALIREAIDQFIVSKRQNKEKRKEAIKAAQGIWAKREDLPDFSTLRAEFDRFS